jgi:hypothetical protein
MSTRTKEAKTKTKEETHEESSESEQEEVTNNSEQEDDEEDDEERIPIDLSENEIYRGVCTLFEDEEGNNILEYISLLHTELIGINKSLENLKLMRKDISRLADCAEIICKGKKSESKEHQPNQTQTQTHTLESKKRSK